MADEGIEVLVGTYNHIIVGLQFLQKEEGDQTWHFEPRFTDQGHDGCIKTVAASERYLASGSTDETIRLYDLRKHVELGSLVQQNGSISDIAFSGNNHMLSASEDGTICVWKCKTWECLKTLKGHRDAINSISVHPTGRLALSVSKDKTVRTWNLLTGRSAYTTSIKQVGDLVIWSPSGDSYVVSSGSKATINKISDTSDVSVIDCPKTILAMDFITPTVLVLAGEAEEVIVYDIEEQTMLQKFKAHEIRVKAVRSIVDPNDGAFSILFTVASDGCLKAWRFANENMKESPVLLAEFFIPGRPVCLTVKQQNKSKKKDRKLQKQEGEQRASEETNDMKNTNERQEEPGALLEDADASSQDKDTTQRSEKSQSRKKKKSKKDQEPEKKKRKKKSKEMDDG